MKSWGRWAGMLGLGILLSATGAMGQARPSCEDQLRAARILQERLAASRLKAEVDAAQAIAELLKQAETFRREIERLKGIAPQDKE